MGLTLSVPTSNESPDTTLGGSAVSGAVDTGFSATTCTANRSSNGTTLQEKSYRSFDFPTVVAAQAIILRGDWAATGSVSATTQGVGDSGSCQIDFTIEYSTNAGSNWSPIVEESVGASGLDGTDASDNLSESGSLSQAISPGVTFSDIQVRAFISATGTVSEVTSASVTSSIEATLSGLQLEVITAGMGMVVCTM